MASQKTKFTVGLFVVGGIGIAMVAIIWLGMSQFLEKGQFYATYFNESVQGLTIDSPVKFRGVSVGRVDRIEVAPDSELIQVVLKIESGQDLESDIVAQLKSVGITGSMFVELDLKVKGEPNRSPSLTFPSEYPIVASKPSEISELLQGVGDVINQIKSLDLKGISDRTKQALDRVNEVIAELNMEAVGDLLKQVKSLDIKGLSDKAKLALDNANRAITDANKNVANITEGVESSLKNIDHIILNADKSIGGIKEIIVDNKKMIKAAIEDFSQAMKNVNALSRGTDDTLANLKNSMILTGQNLEKASENLNRLLDILADQPSQLIFGQPPQPRMIEPEAFD